MMTCYIFSLYIYIYIYVNIYLKVCAGVFLQTRSSCSGLGINGLQSWYVNSVRGANFNNAWLAQRCCVRRWDA